MDDRISATGKEGRMLITPEDGSAPFYAKIEMADDPVQDGTALNKANLLQDSTCVLLNLPTTSVPNDAFAKLALGAGNYGYLIKVQDSSGNPVSGMTVNGVSTITGGTAVTDENGEVLGVSTSTQVSVSVTSPYFDLGDASQSVQSTGIITQVNLAMSILYSENQAVTISSSQTIRFSPNVEEVDFCAIGGGGGGAYGNINRLAGGGGGYVNNLLNQPPAQNDVFSISIGAGGNCGAGNTTPGNGGSTSVSRNSSKILSANGGKGAGNGNISSSTGGTGNGNGANGGQGTRVNGGNGTVYLFDDQDLGLAGGGGGGAGGGYFNGVNISATNGGSPYGGAGSASQYSAGGNGRGPGGGGGGGAVYYDYNSGSYEGTLGGEGAAGAVILRMRYKS